MQNHERESRQRRKGTTEGEAAGGDFGELLRPGRRPPCQLLLLLSDQPRYLSQNLSPSLTHHLNSSLRQLQQLLQLQQLQQRDRADPSLTNLTMVGLLREVVRRLVGRGPTPRSASLGAPSHHREGSRNCELCSPFRCFHYCTWALYLIRDARSPSQWSQLHRPLPEPHREESHSLLARPELNLSPTLFGPN